MQTSETEASQESRKRERHSMLEPYFLTTQKASKNDGAATYPLLSALAANPETRSGFLAVTKAKADLQSDAKTARSENNQDHNTTTKASSPPTMNRAKCEFSGSSRFGSCPTKYPNRNRQMYPTLVAATQVAISTIEENECEMELNQPVVEQPTELQYGYCPVWDKPLMTTLSRRYQRRNSCLGAMSIPTAHKVMNASGNKTVDSFNIFQYETAEPSSSFMIQGRSPLLSKHRKVERRNSQTAAMLYVATQLATIDDNWGQFTIDDDEDRRSTSPTDDRSRLPDESSSSFSGIERPAFKKRRFQM